MCSAFVGSKVGWGYNWGQTANDLDSSFDYVPMLWGTSKGFPDTWQANAQASIDDGAKYLLAFNEPVCNYFHPARMKIS